jgi:MFS family permease
MRGAATLIGTVIGLGLAGTVAQPGTVFIGTALLLALSSFSLFGFVEPVWQAPERVHVARWHDFVIVFLARGFVYFGLTLLMTFVLYFFQDILKAGNPSAGTAFVGIFSLAGAIVASVVLGVLSDRYSRKVIVAICGIPMAIAAIGFALAPNTNAMLVFAVLFGLGLGGILSVGWALAIDSLPELTDVGRALGIWGIATHLPAVIAPAFGGAVLFAFGGSRTGYQTIFAFAGLSFLLASLTVLRVGTRPLSSLLGLPAWLATISSVYVSTRLQHRVRSWGRLRRNRGSTLLIANHQVELEPPVLVSRIALQSSVRHPIFTATSRRLWEPGFFAARFPWTSGLMRRVSMAPIFRVIGFMPIENDLSSRIIASLAWNVQNQHGVLQLADVFSESVASRFPAGSRTCDLWQAANFDEAQKPVRLSELREPYRSEVVAQTRAQVQADVANMEDLMHRGGTMLLFPEGHYSPDGELLPLRGLLPRLSQHADTMYLIGISYDIFRGKRLSILYRLIELRDRNAIADELVVARPVTVTQLLASWLDENGHDFSEGEAARAVRLKLDGVPEELFVDPELSGDSARVTREALQTLLQQGLLTRRDGFYHIERRTLSSFPRTGDIFAYHARFYAQSVATATRRSRQPARN